MDAKKTTIDLLDSNREVLEIIKADYGLTYGASINELIDTFLKVPSSVKRDLVDFANVKLRQIKIEKESSGDMRKKELEDMEESYIKIARILNDRKDISASMVDKPKTKTIDWNSGVSPEGECRFSQLIYPSDWILINDPLNSSYACVIEVSPNYNIPNLVLFTGSKPINPLDEEQKKRAFQICSNRNPDFKKILGLRVEPKTNPDVPGYIENFDEYMNSPRINIYNIPVEGQPKTTYDYSGNIAFIQEMDMTDPRNYELHNHLAYEVFNPEDLYDDGSVTDEYIEYLNKKDAT